MASRSELANTLRVLALDAVHNAGSGHSGMPMGMADIAEVLWNDFMRHNPTDPDWVDRDRFVLSNGHGSMLQYGLLHLSGYALPMEQIRHLRQFGSATPGHPEYGDTPGVETTTGPLGQGFANAVGMALAERALALAFNRGDHRPVHHRTWVCVGDGCLMEGISHEVASLAGTLGLGKLIALYDDNGISIDGPVRGWFTDDTPGRFTAYGWQVIAGVDGHSAEAIGTAIAEAVADETRPSIICFRTEIGRGSPHQAGTAAAHGAITDPAEVAATRAALGWQHPPFEIPQDLYQGWDARPRGAALQQEWDAGFAAYRAEHPVLAAAFERRTAGELPDDWAALAETTVRTIDEQAPKLATRQASKAVLDVLAPALPELLGGSADLTGSNMTRWEGAETLDRDGGNYLYYGVREFGMAAICNGLALHGGVRPFCGTFLVFLDYARSAVRLAALMGLPVVYVFTHDSIGVGGDGPTHQPIEHLTSLRSTPGLDCWRPADAVETAVAWCSALERGDGPSALCLSRQRLPHITRDPGQIAQIARGGYILRDAQTPESACLLIATGSEVATALAALEMLGEHARGVRLVSMPCAERFAAQPQDYRDAVLPPGVRNRLAVEAGQRDYWFRWVGLDGAVLGIDGYGASGEPDALFTYFGLDAAGIAERLNALLSA